MIFGLSNAQAAATLAAVLIGYDLGIFNSNVLNGTVIMILVTCTISSFVTEKAARELVTKQQQDDYRKDKIDTGEERILIPIAESRYNRKPCKFGNTIEKSEKENTFICNKCHR